MVAKRFIKEMTFSLVDEPCHPDEAYTNIDPESSINNTNGQGLELSGYPAVRSFGCNSPEILIMLNKKSCSTPKTF